MQYLLTEEEMAKFQAERSAVRNLPGREIGVHMQLLGDECKKIATTMTPDWRDKPYGCIHVDRRASYGYCDKCPCQRICPLPKDYSK